MTPADMVRKWFTEVWREGRDCWNLGGLVQSVASASAR
jgi:hypothetical protein